MNLFCFSLEGSMDSLYEAVQSSGDGPPPPIPSRSSSRACSRATSRSCSPALLLDDHAKWRGSGRSISMDLPHIQSTNSIKKKRRTHLSKSVSENESIDQPISNTAVWQPARSREDLVHMANNHNEETRKPKHKAESKEVKGAHHPVTKKKEKPPPSQSAQASNSLESKPAVKRSQKPVKKPVGKGGKEASKKSQNTTVHCQPAALSPPTGPNYLEVPYRSDRRPYVGKSSTLPAQENTTPGGRCPEVVHLPGGATPTHTNHHHHHHRLNSPGGDSSPAWGSVQHTCRRPLTEYRMYSQDVATPQDPEWDGRPQQGTVVKDGSLRRERKPSIPPKVPRSVTDGDLLEQNRTTSFGRFEGLRNNSPQGKPEENGKPADECEGSDANKSAGLGKKMKAISLTMRRKMGKKHAKAFSEEMGEDAERDPEAEAEGGGAVEKNSAKTSNSLESLYSGQSSSSGVTSESNGSCKRDSLRLEEDGSYQGPFCGRARVHTDFVPSPYDTDSLKLKVGDIIHIISKPPMGIWTGMLGNKVGNFKFIYVDVLAEKQEEPAEEQVPKIRQQKVCKRPRPKTLLELLERLNLEEYASALLLNGYQTVDDLLHLQEKHLIELNVQDPEHRQRILAAAECHYAEGDDVREVEEHISTHHLQEEDSDCPRDSGCFIPSECSDIKEDAGES